MTTKSDGKERRGFLRYLGMTFLGLVSWPVIRRTPNKSGQGVFASLFLQDLSTVQIPHGYYDPESQLYFDAETNEPMFVQEEQEKEKPISEKELAERLEKEGFISMKDFQKHLKSIRSGRRLRGGRVEDTKCTVTTLKTTSCCPLYTDERQDRIDDD